MERWEQELVDIFGSAVVNKGLALENEIAGIPRYVSEFILGVFGENGIDAEAVKDANEFICANQYSGREKEVLKNKLTSEIRVKVLDKFKAEIDTRKNETRGSLATTKLDNMFVSPSLTKEHERLLIDGIWGLGELRYYSPHSKYEGDETNKEGSIELQKFRALQLSSISLDSFKEGRSQMDTKSWLKALISTIGLQHGNYNLREKLIILSRLIPMVEDSIFMMEFGKPGTGKTYAFENISAYSRVISGSSISAAQLFYNLQRNTPGLIVQYDVVLFDEIDKIRRRGLNEEVINKLYKYLESYSFDRGEVEMSSTCGIMMVGNTSPDKEFNEETLFMDVLHEKIREEAFVSRIAGLIPGWELDTIENRDKSITKDYGFMADYFSEIMHALRKSHSQHNIVNNRLVLKNANIRDEKSIRKITAGLLKLIYPNDQVEDEYFEEIVKYAVGLRQSVVDQNYYLTKKEDYNVKIEWEVLSE